MKFSYHWLKELVGFKESPEKLAEFLTLRAFEVESLVKMGNDWALDVKLFPNRIADASGHIGMAREIAVLQNRRIKNQESRIKESGKRKVKASLAVKIENPEDCPRYTARVMEGIKIGSSPPWLKERLETCGLQSINNVVDAANYIMLETGQPLHVFDREKINSAMSIRRAKKGEKIITLDGNEYALNPEILVIADADKPLAIAGIKGGKSSGVSETTTAIILESANFDPIRIRRGSKALNLASDASYRFERGLDPNQTEIALDRLAELIRKVAGGAIQIAHTDAYPQKRKIPRVLLRAAYANERIGAAHPPAFYRSLLQRLEWNSAPKGKTDFLVEPPSNRLDIAIEEDVIEELARLIGYENISPALPLHTATPKAENDDILWADWIRDYLAGKGFIEHMPYVFTGEHELRRFGLDAQDAVEVANPVSADARYLTPRILTKYIAAAADNIRNNAEVRMFGIAKSFRARAGDTPREESQLVLISAARGVSGEDGFYMLKGIIEQMIESMGITDHTYLEHASDPVLHPRRTAAITVDGARIGVIGEINPTIMGALKTQERIIAAELSFTAPWQAARADTEYRAIAKYPAIMRDIAVVVPEDVRTSDVLNVIEDTAGPLLIDVGLFDYFQDDDRLGEDKKNLAFHLIFQSPERTLKDSEADKEMERITAALAARKWEVRS